MQEKVTSMYGGKLRVRVCGMCIENNSLLLIKHSGLGEKGILWIPPGGGMDFGEDMHGALKREFLEETGVAVEVGDLMFVNEFKKGSLHSIEFFFEVFITSGRLKLGYDPEFPSKEQIIKELRFVTFEEIAIMDKKILHNSLRDIRDKESLLNMSGYFKFWQ